MLFYSDQNSPRLTYILDLISNEIFNEPFILISDKDAFISYTGTKLNYSNEKLSGNEFFIKPHGLLFETDIHQQKINRIDFLNKPAFFETSGDYPFDIFAASFFLVSRYEEYLYFQPDKYGRFPHQDSLAFKENFLDFPLINYWLGDFKTTLRQKFPDIIFRMKDFKFIPTYDIDIAYSYKYKGLKRNLGGFFMSTIKGQWFNLLDRWDVLFNKKRIPLIPMNGWIHCTFIAEHGRIIFFFLRKNKLESIKIFLLRNPNCNR